jgi:transcriptional regulator with XRE-family HTH domain
MGSDAGAGASQSIADPSAIEDARAQRVALIGQRIRELRRERMTLTQLAAASAVSIGLLSRLENGVGNPSFAALSQIARALEVDIHAFFEPPPGDQVVPSSGDRITLRRGRGGANVELLVPSMFSRIVGTMVTLPPGFKSSGLATAQPGPMYEYVVEGSVEYLIETEVHQLERGDFILFDAGRSHARRNLSESTEAKVVSCSTEARLESFFGTPPE